VRRGQSKKVATVAEARVAVAPTREAPRRGPFWFGRVRAEKASYINERQTGLLRNPSRQADQGAAPCRPQARTRGNSRVCQSRIGSLVANRVSGVASIGKPGVGGSRVRTRRHTLPRRAQHMWYR